MNIKSILFCLCLLTSFGTVQAQTEFYQGSWNSLLNQAEKEEKLIFLDLYFVGCMPCEKMDENVFPEERVSAVLNKDFVPYKVDVFKEEIGKTLNMKYAVSGFPTYVIMDSQKRVLNIFYGYQNPETLLKLLEKAKVAERKREFLAYSQSFELDYPDFYKEAFLEGKRQFPKQLLDDYLSSHPDRSSEIPFVVMTAFGSPGVHGDFYLDNSVELAAKYGEAQVGSSLLQIVRSKANTLGKTNDFNAYNDVLAKARSVYDEKDWDKFSKLFYQHYYESSKNAEWLLAKMIGNPVFDWQDQSNLLAQVIIDAKGNKVLLQKLASLYAEQRGPSTHSVDYYKAALISFYLQEYEEAENLVNLALKGDAVYGLKREEIEELKLAIENRDTANFTPKLAKNPKPMTLG